MLYIWEIYIKVYKGRETVSYSDVYHYEQVANIKLTAWEVEQIFKLDQIRIKEYAN